MTNTHTFTLPSGVECEILPADMGDFEMLLSASQKQNTFGDILAKVLAAKIERLGNIVFSDLQPYQREKHVAQMMPCDKDYSLLTMRQFAYEFPTEFTFTIEYGKREKAKFSVPLENGNFEFQPTEPQYKNYDEIPKNFEIEISGKTIKIPMMVGEIVDKVAKGAKGKNDLLFSEAVALRGCAIKNESGWLAMTANDFKKMPPKMFNRVLKEIEKREGKVFATHTFTHPQTEQETTINLIGTKDFFLSED